MSRQFTATGAQAKALQVELGRIRAMALTGGAITGLGLFGLGMMDKALKPAEEYAHQLNVMNMAGMSHADQVKAIGDAWKTTGTVITTTATQNLRTLLDLRNVLGGMGEAQAALPITSRIQAVMGASTSEAISGNAKNFSYDIAKAADIAGYAKDPAQFQNFAEQMAQVIMATQGRVTPGAYLSALKYARQARYSLNDDFLFHYLPTLILENAGNGGGGGGSRGVGPMIAAMFRVTNQGYINKQSLPLLQSLGLVQGNPLATTTTGTTVESLTNAKLAGANPFAWAQQVLMPALEKKYGKNLSREQIAFVVGQLFRGNQLAASAMTEFLVKPFNFERDKRLIASTPTIENAYKSALSNDPNTARAALDAQWENLKVSLMMGLVPLLIPLLTKLANVFMFIGDVLRDHPLLAEGLAIGFTGLFAVMGLVLGPLLLLRAAFGALALALPGMSVSLTGVVSSMKLMGQLGAVIAAGWLGYQVGTLINDYIISPIISKLTGGKDDSLGTWLYDFTHPNQYDPKAPQTKNWAAGPQGATGTWDGPSAVAPGAGSKTTVVHTHIHVDGREVARAVTKHQTRAMSGPSIGSQGLSTDQFIPSDAPSLATR